MKPRVHAALTLTLFAGALGSGASPAREAGSVVQWGTFVVPYVEPGTRFKAIASGTEYTFLAVKEDGTVIGWGQNGYHGATVPQGLSNVIAVSEATQSV